MATTIKCHGAKCETSNNSEHKRAEEEGARGAETAGRRAVAKDAIVEDAERDVEVDASRVAFDRAPAAATAELAHVASGVVVARGGAAVLNEAGASVVVGKVFIEKLARRLLAFSAPQTALLGLLVARVARVKLVAVRLGARVRGEAQGLGGIDARVRLVAPAAARRGDAGTAGRELLARGRAREAGDETLLGALVLAADLVATPRALIALSTVEVVETRVTVEIGRARARGRDETSAVGIGGETGRGRGTPGTLRIRERRARGTALVLIAGARRELGAGLTRVVVPLNARVGRAAPGTVVIAERALTTIVRH